MKPSKFVVEMLSMCGVEHVDEIKREQINHSHGKLLCDFLSDSPGANLVLLRLFNEADVYRSAVHLAGSDDEFQCSGFAEMTKSERIIICRIVGSQGREMEFTNNGIIVSPHRDVMKKQRQSLQMQVV